MDAAYKTRLSTILARPVLWNCQMAGYTSFAIGGPAAALVEVTEKQELQGLLAFLRSEKTPWRVIGRGTNILVNDKGFPGVIIVLAGSFREISAQSVQEKVIVSAGAGCSWTRLHNHCIQHGYTGLEFGFGIPGTLGGAVLMNAGAWGQEISTVVQAVEITTHDAVAVQRRDELIFSYRRWDDFTQYLGRGVVTAVELGLTLTDSEKVRQRCSALHEKRLASQPLTYPNAGSFFKNPPGEAAGRLIDLCGLKGMAVGDAMVSQQHGNFFVNRGNATAAEIISLMKHVQKQVKRKFGIELEPEVHFI